MIQPYSKYHLKKPLILLKDNLYKAFRFKVTGLLFILCGAMVFVLKAQTYKINKYGLKVIEDPLQYKNSITANAEMELVALERLIPGLKTDFVYATPHNFTGKILYHHPKAFLRRPAALALQKVAAQLATQGFGLLIYDAYRPYKVTVKMWEVVPDNRYAADPRYGSGHNRGLSVDLSLYDLKTGNLLLMPTEFDNFSLKAHQDYKDLPDKVLRNRKLLKNAMMAGGFKPLRTEWWHFSYPGSNTVYNLLDIPFSALNEALH